MIIKSRLWQSHIYKLVSRGGVDKSGDTKSEQITLFQRGG